MRHRPSFLCVAALVLGAMPAAGVSAAAAAAGDTYSGYSGTAAAESTGKFLYHESHVLHFRDGKLAERVVLYTCSDGAPFARKTLSYADPLAPDFVLEDASNGMRQGVRTHGNTRDVFFRGERGAAEKSGTVPLAAGSVADAGFDEFVRANWQPLVGGQTLDMKFLVPSRLQEMGFKVQRLRSAQVDGVPVEVFRLKVSGVIGWIAPNIDVYYSTSDHVLTRFVGVSDLRDASHDNYVATIDFHPADRKASDERAMNEARGAQLAPCH